MCLNEFFKNKLCFRTALQILLIISFHSRDQRKVRRKFNLSLLIHVSRNVKSCFFLFMSLLHTSVHTNFVKNQAGHLLLKLLVCYQFVISTVVLTIQDLFKMHYYTMLKKLDTDKKGCLNILSLYNVQRVANHKKPKQYIY